MSQDGTTMELVGDCEIRISRSFDAPAALVFEALHKPEHVRRWWAPRSRGEMTLCEIDLRLGGGWRFQMKTTRGDIVGFHGQTVLHRPHQKLTWQIGDGAGLAAASGIDVVFDFRTADVAALHADVKPSPEPALAAQGPSAG